MNAPLHNWATERISQRIFYVVVGIILVMFSLFYLVGYDLPYLFNPDFNAPLFTGAIIWLMLALLAIAGAFCIWAVARSIKTHGKSGQTINNIPVKRISYAVLCTLIGTLVITFIFGSTTEIPVNGEAYTNRLWLKISDMFIFTAFMLLIIAVGAVVFGATRYYRKKS